MDSKSQSGAPEASAAKNLTQQELSKYRGLLRQAFTAAHNFTGSEQSERKLLKPLILVDQFVQARNSGKPSEKLETVYAKAALSDNSETIPSTVDDILEIAEIVYDKMLDAKNQNDILGILQNGGALVKQSNVVFVQTDDGEVNIGASDASSKFEVKTQPRLAMLVSHLRDEGIYTDDLIIQEGKADPKMVREHPYHIVQIPRLDKEIAVCDQVGEITFVKNGIIGTDLWANLSKDYLKERSDIQTVIFNSERQWWTGIKTALSEHALNSKIEVAPKVDLVKFSRKKPHLDIDLIKQSILAHKDSTKRWPTANSGKVLYGHYSDRETWSSIHSALERGGRGLSGGSSIPTLKEELGWVNHLKKDSLNVGKIKQDILAHKEATGDWPTNNSGDVKYGFYASKESWGSINTALTQGNRGLSGGSSIPALKEELGYENHLKKDSLDIGKIKQGILAHKEVTGDWPTKNSGDVKYDFYAGKESWFSIDSALRKSGRGLLNESSLSKIKEELGWVNPLKQDILDVDLIKQCILAYEDATGLWPTHLSGSVENGYYEGEETWGGIQMALSQGLRGLSAGSSLSILKEELGWKNRLKIGDLDIELIKQSIADHKKATGKWPIVKGGEIKYGPYAGENTWSAIDAALSIGCRGLSGGLSLLKLRQEIVADKQVNPTIDDDNTPQPI